MVGGWTPDLLLPEADEPHIGSIDVDLALDAIKLRDGDIFGSRPLDSVERKAAWMKLFHRRFRERLSKLLMIEGKVARSAFRIHENELPPWLKI